MQSCSGAQSFAATTKILVENARNDGAFVRRMLPPSWRDRLQRWEEAAWAEFENGGGLPELRKMLEGLEIPRVSRRVAIFDSDALRPDEPSKESARAWDVCGKKAVEPLQLKRRAAENYLPVATLVAWSAQKERVRAFKRLTPEQRHHYPMRDGLEKDHAPELFANLSKRDREALMAGFGDIRGLFANDDLFTEFDLESDDLHGEREKLRALIFSNL